MDCLKRIEKLEKILSLIIPQLPEITQHKIVKELVSKNETNINTDFVFLTAR